MTRIYPDTLDKLEIQSGQSEDHWQIYSITDGMGGSGIGDLSGRLVQEELIKEVASLGNIDPHTFDFAQFAYEFVEIAKIKLKERLARYKNQEVGCSLAFILVNGSIGYTLSIGTNRLYLIRNNKIYRMSDEHKTIENGVVKPSMFLGNSLTAKEAKPDNLNKLVFETDDIVLLLSDGFYNIFSDSEILKLSQSDSSFVKVINNFNSKLTKNTFSDDCTVLGLKVLEAGILQVSERFHQDQPTEQVHLRDIDDLEDQVESNYSFSDDDYFANDEDNSNFEYQNYEENSQSKFIQGIILFLKSYGIGILAGSILIFLFWLFYIRLG